jgi:hypothetical protein
MHQCGQIHPSRRPDHENELVSPPEILELSAHYNPNNGHPNSTRPDLTGTGEGR